MEAHITTNLAKQREVVFEKNPLLHKNIKIVNQLFLQLIKHQSKAIFIIWTAPCNGISQIMQRSHCHLFCPRWLEHLFDSSAAARCSRSLKQYRLSVTKHDGYLDRKHAAQLFSSLSR